MLFVNTISYYDDDNRFRLKEILVSDDKVTYSLSPEGNFAPTKYPMSLNKVIENSRSSVSYPVLGFNKTRMHKDDDPYSLATYLANKFRAIGDISPREEKVIFDVMSSFGEEYAEG